jgi:trans-aconitate methyltransferase
MSGYNWNAVEYERNSQAQQKWAEELMGKLRLTGSEDVLDVGCGTGKVTADIAGMVVNGSVLGIDNSSSMIDLAKERHPKNEYPNLLFQVMDAAYMSFTDRFDVVFSNAALHWVRDHTLVVQGMFNSLKPGGRILLQMGGKGNAEQVLSVVDDVQTRTEWRVFFVDFEFPYSFLGVEEYERLLSDAGFTINRVELIPKDMVHSGIAGLEGWIRTTWLPYTERVPEVKRDTFIEEISREYVSRVPGDTDGNVHVAMVRLEVEAEKML